MVAVIDTNATWKRGSEDNDRAVEKGNGADISNRYDEYGDAENSGMDEGKVGCVVQIMFERYYVDCRYIYDLGIAFKARDKLRVQEVLECACLGLGLSPTKYQAAIRYALDVSMSLISAKSFRVQVLTIVAKRLARIYGGATVDVAAGGGGGLISVT